MAAMVLPAPREYITVREQKPGLFGALRTPSIAVNRIHVRHAVLEDVPHVLKMVRDEAQKSGALIELSEKELVAWIERGHSLVAVVGEKIVGHLAVDMTVEPGWAEVRSVVVLEEHRKKWVYTTLMIDRLKMLLEENPDIKVIYGSAPSGGGRGLLRPLGFKERPLSDAPESIVKQAPKGGRIFVAYGEELRQTAMLKELVRPFKKPMTLEECIERSVGSPTGIDESDFAA